MNNQQYLLLKLSEEASEISHIVAKTMQFGFNSTNNGALPLTNKEQIFKELNDLTAVVELLNEECGLSYVPCANAVSLKKEAIKKYRARSQQLDFVRKD